MLTIVMANPMLLTMVSEAPLEAGGALLAIRVENIGESATMVIPHIKRKTNKSGVVCVENTNGESKQQVQEINKAVVATFLGPVLNEIIPPKIQAIDPEAIIRKDTNETVNSVPGACNL